MKSWFVPMLFSLPLLMGVFLSFRQAHARQTWDVATFAGGCFWCMVSPYERMPGVKSVVSGYTGGHVAHPTYEQVSTGQTGHVEAVQITYDPRRTSYQDLLDAFWRHIDPTDPQGQFADKGPQYHTAIFYHNEGQKRLAEASKADWERSGKFSMPIATVIRPAAEFFPAEEYHQDYHQKNPAHYLRYYQLSGRAGYLEKTWKSETPVRGPARPGREELKKSLSPLQFKVTQENGTEPPFQNEYWNNRRQGLYVDVVTGEALFSSEDKFDSDCGWPSFTKPLKKDDVVEREDNSLWMRRTEVRSRGSDSHLGHVFNDGPRPTGLRYCINSAALRFVPREEMEKEGYGQYLSLFQAGQKP